MHLYHGSEIHLRVRISMGLLVLILINFLWTFISFSFFMKVLEGHLGLDLYQSSF